jgi:hypothetical protein
MKKVTLGRNQILKLATMLTLDDSIESVTITEEHTSGIGAGHRAYFNKSLVERSFEDDITDVSNW